MSFWQADTPLSSPRIMFSESRTVVRNPVVASETGLRWTHFWLKTGCGNLTLPEAIAADHEADDEPVILKFPTAKRQRQKPPPKPVGKIKRRTFLGGLLSHYERVAA